MPEYSYDLGLKSEMRRKEVNNKIMESKKRECWRKDKR